VEVVVGPETVTEGNDGAVFCATGEFGVVLLLEQPARTTATATAIVKRTNLVRIGESSLVIVKLVDKQHSS
jgi:hypothetical protein